MKRLLTLLLATSFLLVTVCGCASNSAPIPELASEESKPTKFIVDGKEINVDYSETERDFLDNFEMDWACQYTLYDASELTSEVLENRCGSLIIERCIGIVTDADFGDGRLLNFDDGGYYISYSDVNGIRDGSIVLSYMVYNPNNNYIDDIMERYDYLISTEYED